MSINILSKKTKEQNSFVNGDLSRNGGGYSQPLTKYVLEFEGERYFFEEDDTSCGEFGRRIYKTLFNAEKEVLCYSDIDTTGRQQKWDCNFDMDNPLHIALLHEGLLEMCDFKEEEEE